MQSMDYNQHWTERDLAVLWHPCTQMKDHQWLPLIPVARAEGVWLEDFNGRRYLDAISSWWVNLFGHCHPHISAAVKAQLDTLEHVLLAGFSHEPAITLAEKLIALTPSPLRRCFFADNGSAAVEAALKMSFHYWRNRGHVKKSKFAALANSYHGETLGALAVGDVALYKETYQPLLMEALIVPGPDNFLLEPGQSPAELARQAFAQMERLLAERHEELCAVIVEPLVQCAGHMRMYDAEYLRLLRHACDHYGVHLIADEIAVGFGRTGTLFACEQAGIAPDMMCLSKGLTGGYLPLSAVLTTDEVYNAFYDDYENLTAFLHSHSYTGNALACRAGIATLELFEQLDPLTHNRRLSDRMLEGVSELADHPHVGDIRRCGMIVAVEMVKDRHTRQPYPWQQRRGLRVYQYALTQGVLLRPLGNVIYFMPPYVIREEEITLMTRTAIEGIHRATAGDS